MEALNTQLLRFFDWLLWTTIQGSMLVVLIVLIQKLLRRKLPVRWHYLLWLLLLVRLASPWLPESRISIFNLVPQSVQQGRIIESFSESRSADGMDFYLYDEAPEPENDSEAISVRFARMLPVLWLLGTVAIGIYVCVRNISLWRTVKRERPITDQKILDLLEDCKMQMHVETIVAVVVSDRIKSPALFGFIRPRLLLPQGMLETYGLEELRYIFIHELAHLKQRDVYLGWLMALLHVAHWFNPLMWFAFSRIRADREIACDRLAISTMESDEPPEYGRTIVSLLERFSQTRYLPSVAGILEDTCQIERRIKMIADYKKTSPTRWTGAMLLLAVLACVVLTNAYVAKADFTFGTPTNLGPTVNGGAVMDFYPNISADGLSLYFTSDRAGGSGDRDLWVTTRPTTGDDWEPPVNMGPIVNSPLRDQSSDISEDGLEFYFASSRPGGFGSEDLWVTTRTTTDDPWGTPVNLGQNVNSSALDHSPSISADGLSLYFASNRNGGFGSYDIWMTKRSTPSDPWEEPVNLGPTVNSQSGDSRPSISRDGLALFFGSLRPGPGYRNIYVSTRTTTDGIWGTAVILGPSVNDGGQNSYPCISADGSTLYFATDRSDSRGDIWQVPILPIVDLNGDGKVDFKDFRKLAQYLGQYEPSCDIAPLPNGDGIVDEYDLNLFAKYLAKEFQPVAHWNMDETEGSIAHDSIGENDGTLNGGLLWQPTGGKTGGALQFDGVDDYVSTPFILDPSKGSFSVFAWIKGGAPGQVIISQRSTTEGRKTNPGSAWLWADSSYGRLITRLMHPPFDPLLSETVITDGQWHHVGLVYDFDGLKRYLYMDGAEVAKDTDFVGGVGSSGGLYFGAGNMLDAGSFFSGLIDDIRIYDELLSAGEVAELAR